MLNSLACVNPGVIQSVTSPEAELCPSHDLSFETARMDANDDILISTRRVVMNDKSQSGSEEVAEAARKELPIEQQILHTETHREENENVMTREVNSDVK